jgi:hypothetical protein
MTHPARRVGAYPSRSNSLSKGQKNMLHLANALGLALASAAAIAPVAAPSTPASPPAQSCSMATIRTAAPAKRAPLSLPDRTRNLTVEQQNAAEEAEREIEFNIEHSP